MTSPGIDAINSADRPRWMSELALAAESDLVEAIERVGPTPAYEWLRQPETGLVMVRGRIGGDGSRFNIGEMTITRCALTLGTGETGISYVRGASREHARNAALLDAMLQSELWHEKAMILAVLPLREIRHNRRKAAKSEADATRVEFYTMVRGDS